MIGECPECEAEVPLAPDDLRGSIVVCPECGVELEVIGVDPVELDLLPPDAWDYGE